MERAGNIRQRLLEEESEDEPCQKKTGNKKCHLISWNKKAIHLGMFQRHVKQMAVVCQINYRQNTTATAVAV